MSEERPEPEAPAPAWRTRQPLTISPFGGAGRGAMTIVYAVLAVGLTGFALYMGLGERHPLTSAQVAAPAIGAAWFALRLMMMLGPRS